MVVSSLALSGDLGTKLIRASGAGGGESPRELRAFVHAVAEAFDAPLAGVSILIGQRLWIGPAFGMTPGWCEPAAHFCRDVITHNAAVSVPNTLAERALADDPFVRSCGVRSYLGVPLRVAGKAVGTLWIANRQPRAFTSEHEKALAALADAYLSEVEDADLDPHQPPARAYAGVGFFEADFVTDQALVAGSLFERAGVGPSRVPIKALIDGFTDPLNRELVAALLNKTRAAPGPFETSIVLAHPAGCRRAFAVLGLTEHSTDRVPLRASGAVIEVSGAHEPHRGANELARGLDLATRAAAIGVWDWDIVSNEARFNRAWLDIYGLNEGSFGIDQWLELVHPDDRAIAEEAHAAAFADERTFDVTVRIRRTDGVERRVRASGIVLRDGSGRAARMIGTSVDVTEEFERAELHSVTAERLSLAVEAFGAGVWDFDFRSLTATWDARMFQIYGRRNPRPPTRDEWLRYIHPDDRSAAEQSSELAIRAGQPLSLRFRIVRDDGVTRHIQVNGTVRIDEQRRPVRCTGVARDVTDELDAQRQAESTRQFLEQTGALARVGGWMLDLPENRLTWSDEVRRIHEVPGDYVPEVATAIQFYPGHAATIIHQHVERAIAEARPYDVELPLRTAKGRDIWIRTIAQPVVANGRVVRLVGALQDITALHQTNQRLRLITENMEDWVALTAVDGTLLYVSPSFHRATGWTDEDLRHAAIDSRIHPEDTELVRSDRGKILAGHASTVRYRYLCKSGEYIWIERRSTPIADDRGRVTMYSSTSRNVSREQGMIDELRASEERFRLLADHTSDWVGISQIDGTPIFDSPSFYRISGWTAEDIRAAPLISRIHADDRRVVEDHLRGLSRGLACEARYRYRIKDGSYLWRDCHSVPIRDADGSVSRFVWSSRDITAEAEALEALRESAITVCSPRTPTTSWAPVTSTDGRSTSVHRSSGSSDGRSRKCSRRVGRRWFIPKMWSRFAGTTPPFAPENARACGSGSATGKARSSGSNCDRFRFAAPTASSRGSSGPPAM